MNRYLMHHGVSRKWIYLLRLDENSDRHESFARLDRCVKASGIGGSAQELLVVKVLTQFQKELEEGALISVDPEQARVRILPVS